MSTDTIGPRRDVLVRTCWLLAAVLIAIPLLLRLTVLISTPIAHVGNIVDFIYDDGYYYLAIAANLAEFGRSTLDGVTATNGYQPAWLLVLTGLAKLVGVNARAFFTATCALIYAIACLTPLIALVWRNSISRSLALCLAAGLAFVIAQQPVVFLNGLEPILFPPLAVAIVVLLERRDGNASWYLKLSALLACAFLVRVDALALYIAVCISLPMFETLAGGSRLRGAPGRGLALAIRLSILLVPVVLGYLLINQWLFGSPVPVSGRAKALGGPFFSNWGILPAYFAHLKSIALLLVILLPLEFFARRFTRRVDTLLYRSIMIFSLAVAIQYLYYALFSTWLLWPWYQYLVSIDMALIIARIIYLSSRFDLRQREGLIGLAALLIIGAWAASNSLELAVNALPRETQGRLTLLHAFGFRPDQSKGRYSQEQANLAMLGSFFDPGRNTVIAMGDRSGGLAYWGRGTVTVVQTEGLTLGMDYLRARTANAGERYLEHFPIEYMIVDREIIPTTVDSDGHVMLVIADPIQGRVSTTPVPTFCFPSDAIRYRASYPSSRGISTRVALLFSDRVPCSQQTLSRLRTIETGIGLRQFSLPSEYDSAAGNPLSKRSEDRDRHYRADRPENPGFGHFVAGEQLAQQAIR